jgi:hypothetical protein
MRAVGNERAVVVLHYASPRRRAALLVLRDATGEPKTR